ncbi:hypothetical protein A4W76_08800 [Latilactobacillus curvatus]|nr:hypothetical protein A4W76_08800 [Latilactobacillus curvatus]
MQYVYAKNGIKLPRVSQDQSKLGKDVPLNELQPNDLLFWEGLEQPTMSQSTLVMATLSKHHNLAIKFELLKFQITNQILPVVYHKKIRTDQGIEAFRLPWSVLF